MLLNSRIKKKNETKLNIERRTKYKSKKREERKTIENKKVNKIELGWKRIRNVEQNR